MAETPKSPPLAQVDLSTDRTRDAVLRVAQMLSTVPPVPVLMGIKISFLGARVHFEAGDYQRAGFAEVSTTARTAQTNNTAEVLVNGTTLARVIRRAPDGVLTLTALHTALVVSAQRWSARLVYMPVEDYPNWSSLYTGEPTDEYDERVYGNSAATAKPIPPDARDRALPGEPLAKPKMWKRPHSKRGIFQPKPFGVGDWLKYTDSWGRQRIGQVWSAASTNESGTLLVITCDQSQLETREFTVSGSRRKDQSFYLRDEQNYPGEDKPRIVQCQLERTSSPPEEGEQQTADNFPARIFPVKMAA